MPINFKRTLAAAAIILCAASTSIPANAMPAKVLSIAPDLLNIEQNANGGSFTKVSGYHWVNPYFRSDGTFVRGHMRGNPDGLCFNNLSGC
jgi:hypothetical protein